MNSTIISRYITIMVILTFVMGLFWIFWDYVTPVPGDFEVRQGDIHLNSQEWEAALEDFDLALAVQPNHRGALMGRALVFLQTGRDGEAEAELDYLIAFLERTLNPDDPADDPTGVGTLAGAYANRGILRDRQGRHEDALADYIKALSVDAEAVEGPGIVQRILYDANPSSVKDRAVYLYEEFQKPESERLLRVPDIDARQRMFKP